LNFLLNSLQSDANQKDEILQQLAGFPFEPFLTEVQQKMQELTEQLNY